MNHTLRNVSLIFLSMLIAWTLFGFALYLFVIT